MRPFILLLTVAVLATGVACDTASMVTTLPSGAAFDAPDGIDPRSPNIERNTRLIDFDDIRTVRLEVPVGRISVTQAPGDARATMQVTEIITREGLPVEALTDLLNNTGLTAERAFVDQQRLDIDARIAPELDETEVLFDVRLTIPVNANIEVLVNNGPVSVSDLTGNVEIRTDNGEIDITSVKGNIIAQTSSRPIVIADVNGDVLAETTDADIDLQLTPGLDGRISAETTTGAIFLMVPRTTSASVMLTSDQGSVAADLNGFDVTNISTRAGFLQGNLNGGGGAIEARSLAGEISFLGM